MTSPTSRRRCLAALGALGAVGVAAVAGAQETRPATEPATNLASGDDAAAAIATVNRVAMLTDLREWAALRQVLAGEVAVDYESFHGTPPFVAPADQLVAEWAAALSIYDATHHLVGSHMVLPGLRVLSNVTITHARRAPAGLNSRRDFEWTIGGRYEHTLVRVPLSPTGLAVTAVAFTRLWESGDRRIGTRNFGE